MIKIDTRFYNFMLILSFFVLKLIDLITTYIALANGFFEMNPFAILDPFWFFFCIGGLLALLLLGNIVLKEERVLIGVFLILFNLQAIWVLLMNFKII